MKTRTAQTAPDRTTQIETVDSSGNFHDADSKSGVTRAIVLVPALRTRNAAPGSGPDGGNVVKRPDTNRKEEAIGLAGAIDLEVAEALIVPISDPRPSTLFGKGKMLEIKALIDTSSTQVGTGVTLVNQTGTALGEIETQVGKINDLIQSIVTGAREQSTALAEINSAINQMDQTTQQNAAMVEESNAASAELAAEAGKLRELISQFTIDGSATAQSAVLRQTARTMARPAQAETRRPAADAARPQMRSQGNAAIAQDSWEEF